MSDENRLKKNIKAITDYLEAEFPGAEVVPPDGSSANTEVSANTEAFDKDQWPFRVDTGQDLYRLRVLDTYLKDEDDPRHLQESLSRWEVSRRLKAIKAKDCYLLVGKVEPVTVLKERG